MTAVFRSDEIIDAIDQAAVIDAIEAGFVAFSRGDVDVPPVGLLHFDDPPGDVHIKYGVVRGDDVYVVKVASGFYDNPGPWSSDVGRADAGVRCGDRLAAGGSARPRLAD